MVLRRGPAIERFWDRVMPEPMSGCWLWLGGTTRKARGGYGRFAVDGVATMAHRFAYEHFVAAIPEDLEIDHLCRNTLCVNPEHMEPVTHLTNVLRGQSPSARHARQVRCKQGHLLAGDNLIVIQRHTKKSHRACKTCREAARQRERISAAPTKDEVAIADWLAAQGLHDAAAVVRSRLYRTGQDLRQLAAALHEQLSKDHT
jgi:hypothetical protein